MNTNILFMHTADLHLGAQFISLGEKAHAQREQLRETFNHLINVAIDKKVDFVLFAGDTFDSNKPSFESIAVFKQGIKKLSSHHVPAIIIGGTHDAVNDQSVLKTIAQELNGDLFLLDQNNLIWSDEQKQVCVYGVSLINSNLPLNPILELTKINKKGACWNIGMVHGALNIGQPGDKEARFSLDDIADSKMDYLALGHWHNTQDYSRGQTCCWYAGSPEMIAVDEKGQGNILLVELKTGQSPQVNKMAIGKRQLLNKEIDVSHMRMNEILDSLSEFGNDQVILTLVLNGQATIGNNFDLTLVKYELEKLFFHVRIKDKTHMLLSKEALSEFSDETVIGKYVQLLKNAIEQADEEKRKDLEQVLQLGVGLMLGKDIKLWS